MMDSFWELESSSELESSWSDRWTPEELAEALDTLSFEAAQRRGAYETAAILADAADALQEYAHVFQNSKKAV